MAVEKFDGYFADDPSYFDGKTGVSQGFEKTIDWGRDEEDNYSLVSVKRRLPRLHSSGKESYSLVFFVFAVTDIQGLL